MRGEVIRKAPISKGWEGSGLLGAGQDPGAGTENP